MSELPNGDGDASNGDVSKGDAAKGDASNGDVESPLGPDDDPRQLFGTVETPLAGSGGAARRRPDGVSDATVAALGKLSEALEVVEYARGLLYEFHRRCGTADRQLQEATGMLRDAGHPRIASELDDVLVGRDVLPGLWTFQVIEAYEEQYWSVFRQLEARARLLAGEVPRHLFEAEMKSREQQPDRSDSLGAAIERRTLAFLSESGDTSS